MNKRIAERYAFQILQESIERVCDTPLNHSYIHQRRRYMAGAKETWAETLRALDR